MNRRSESAGQARRINKQRWPRFFRKAVPREQSDEALLARVITGDSAALETLYDRYASLVMGIAFKIVGDFEMAEDIVQETFWRVWTKGASFKPDRGPLKAWLLKITRNLAIDAYRRRAGRSQLLADQAGLPELDQTPDPDVDVPEQAWLSLKYQQVQKALETLPEVQRQVLEMAYFLGMTRQEIAEATGEALGTIHTRARLGLLKLRQALQEQRFEL